ncbi:hypothetical protein F5984_10965 [Rudanella paleaurantiibacter]|uniref:Type II toxin-antitoxin system RelE/ParE family toxin n=1 Tax=Rudanella paleaurantiibacter TaxID=2614655 RepID=A0A7J5U0V9_9BACT|nr:type II toxin-antitoxin system RelE/ParE family toxin [Rudanella paleaurantiibacter]KAB7731309.1 hypothetical protein F5984_10965 [Rudanella paleaurantiibacter]
MTGDKSFQVLISDSAEADLKSIVAYLATEQPTKLLPFSDDIRKARAFLTDNPFLYQDYFAFVKRAPLRRSGYNLYYAVDEVNNEVEIIAIFHQKESPQRLRERINL